MESSIKNSIINLILLIVFILVGMTFVFGISLFMAHSNNIGWQEMQKANMMDHLSSKQMMILQLSSHIFGLILPVFFLSKLRLKGDFSATEFDSRTWLISFFFFISCLPLVGFSAWLNQQIPLPQMASQTETEIQDLLNKLLTFNNIGDLILALVTVSIIPGIAEEWIFRGVVQKQLSIIFNNKNAAWIFASLLFSFIHFQFEGFLPRMLLGMALGYVYLKTNNLWYSILLHMLFNGFQVMTVYFSGKQILDENPKDQITASTALASLLILPLTLWIGNKLHVQHLKKMSDA